MQGTNRTPTEGYYNEDEKTKKEDSGRGEVAQQH